MFKSINVFTILLTLASCSPSNNNNNNNNNDDNGSQVIEGTTLARALSLSQNVEKLPSMASVYGATESNSNNNTKKAYFAKTNRKVDPSIPDEDTKVTDLTTPSSDYLNYSALDVYYKDVWDRVDTEINLAKSTKDYVVANIIQFNVWVNLGSEGFDDSTYYKLDYDKDNDVVKIDEYKTNSKYQNFKYSHIDTYYNSNNETIINLTSYAKESSSYKKITTINYVENEYWKAYIDIFENSREYGYLIQADLSKEDREVTQINFYNNGGDTGYQKLIHTVKDGVSFIEFSEEALSYNKLVYYCYTPSGHNLVQVRQYEDNYLVNLSLYHLSGWTSYKVYSKENETDIWNQSYYELKTNNNKSVIGKSGYFDYEEWNRYEVEDGYYTAGITTSGITCEPTLIITTPNSDISLATYEVMNELGLSFTNDVASSIEYLLTHADDILVQRSAFGTHGFKNISDDDCEAMVNEYKLDFLGDEEWNKLATASKILKDQQVMSEERYEMLTPVQSGNATLNSDDLMVNMRDVTYTLPKSALLTVGNEYQMVVGYQKDGNYQVLAESDRVSYDNTSDLVISMNSIAFKLDNLKDIEDEFDYVITAQLYSIKDLVKTRVSENINVSIGDENYSNSDTWDEEKADYNNYTKLINHFTSTFAIRMVDDSFHVSRVINVVAEEVDMEHVNVNINSYANYQDGSIKVYHTSHSVTNTERLQKDIDYKLNFNLYKEESTDYIKGNTGDLSYNKDTDSYSLSIETIAYIYPDSIEEGTYVLKANITYRNSNYETIDVDDDVTMNFTMEEYETTYNDITYRIYSDNGTLKVDVSK